MSRPKIRIPQSPARKLALLPLLCAAAAVTTLPAGAATGDSSITGSLITDPGTTSQPQKGPDPAKLAAKAADQAAKDAAQAAKDAAKAADQAARDAAEAARKQAEADRKAAQWQAVSSAQTVSDDSTGTGRKLG
jgi:hypothetical protein